MKKINLPSGSYEYRVTGDGFADSVGTFEVTDSDNVISVNLESNIFTLKINVVPATILVEVKIGDIWVQGNTFNLKPGIYEYRLSGGGYNPYSTTVEIIDSDVTLDLIMDDIEFKISFAYNYSDIVSEIKIKDKWVDGDTHMARPGKYEYAVHRPGYASINGECEVINKDIIIPILFNEDFRRLNIRTIPDSAKVDVNIGRDWIYGKNHIISRGKYKIVGFKEGYKDAFKEVEMLSSDLNVTLVLELEDQLRSIPRIATISSTEVVGIRNPSGNLYAWEKKPNSPFNRNVAQHNYSHIASYGGTVVAIDDTRTLHVIRDIDNLIGMSADRIDVIDIDIALKKGAMVYADGTIHTWGFNRKPSDNYKYKSVSIGNTLGAAIDSNGGLHIWNDEIYETDFSSIFLQISIEKEGILKHDGTFLKTTLGYGFGLTQERIIVPIGNTNDLRLDGMRDTAVRLNSDNEIKYVSVGIGCIGIINSLGELKLEYGDRSDGVLLSDRPKDLDSTNISQLYIVGEAIVVVRNDGRVFSWGRRFNVDEMAFEDRINVKHSPLGKFGYKSESYNYYNINFITNGTNTIRVVGNGRTSNGIAHSLQYWNYSYYIKYNTIPEIERHLPVFWKDQEVIATIHNVKIITTPAECEVEVEIGGTIINGKEIDVIYGDRITITSRHPGLRDYVKTYTITEDCTIEIVMNTLHLLTIHTIPLGVNVVLNGEPYTEPVLLEEGIYPYMGLKKGYAIAKGDIKLLEDTEYTINMIANIELNFDVRPPAVYEIEMESYVERLSTDKFLLEPNTFYKYKITGHMVEDYHGELMTNDVDTTEVVYMNPLYKLTVTTLPCGAKIMIDNKPYDGGVIILPKGAHVVIATLPGYVVAKRQFYLNSNMDLVIEMVMMPIVTFNIIPDGIYEVSFTDTYDVLSEIDFAVMPNIDYGFTVTDPSGKLDPQTGDFNITEDTTIDVNMSGALQAKIIPSVDNCDIYIKDNVDDNIIIGDTIMVQYMSDISYSVFKTGYFSVYEPSITILEDTTIHVDMDKSIASIIIIPLIPESVPRRIQTELADGEIVHGDTITPDIESEVKITVSADGYKTVFGEYTIYDSGDIYIDMEEVEGPSEYIIEILPTPTEATVVMNSGKGDSNTRSMMVEDGTRVNYSVSLTGYRSVSSGLMVTRDESIPVNLILEENVPTEATLKIITMPSTAIVLFKTEDSPSSDLKTYDNNEFTVFPGTDVFFTVTAGRDYNAHSQLITVNEDMVLEIDLSKLQRYILTIVPSISTASVKIRISYDPEYTARDTIEANNGSTVMYKVEAEGYQTVEASHTITKVEAIYVDLQPKIENKFKLTVITEPIPALVNLNGIDRPNGVTNLELSEGDHVVEGHSHGYMVIPETIKLTKDTTHILRMYRNANPIVAAGWYTSTVLWSNGTIATAVGNYGSKYSHHISRAPKIWQRFRHVATGRDSSAAVGVDGTIFAWGHDTNGQVSNLPTETDFVMVDAGWRFAMAQRREGQIRLWGEWYHNKPPADDTYFRFAAGWHHCALITFSRWDETRSGNIECYGFDHYGCVTNHPPGHDFIDVKCGGRFCLALSRHGTLHSWGWDNDGVVSNTPKGNNFEQITCGHYTAAAIDKNGRIHVWGQDTDWGLVKNKPNSNIGYRSVALGFNHGIAMRKNGWVEVWGDKSNFRADINP